MTNGEAKTTPLGEVNPQLRAHILFLIWVSKENAIKIKKQLPLTSHIPRHSYYYCDLALKTLWWGSHAKSEGNSHSRSWRLEGFQMELREAEI